MTANHIKLITTVCIGALLTGIASAPATAQQSDDETDVLAFEKVVVTANKREENLQDVAVSVTAVSSEDLDLFGGAGDDIQFLSARVPSVVIESSFGRIFPRAYIRGLGNTDFDLNASQPVSFVYDEVVFENPVLKGFPVFDVEQVEVLRGPQGTLFGRNTPAGIIKFDSVKPGKELDGYARLSYGRFNAFQAEGAVGGPITDWLALRASAQYQRRDDFIENVVLGPDGDTGGFDDFAYRVQALFEPVDQFSWLLNVHGRVLDDGQINFQANSLAVGSGGAVPGFDRTVSFADAGADSFLEADTFGVTSKAEYDVGDFATLTYVFGYERVESFSRGDVDGGFGAQFLGVDPAVSGPLALTEDGTVFTSAAFPDGFVPLFPAETADSIDNLDQFTHEVRLSNGKDETFDWTLGFYYFDEDLEIGSFNFATLAGGAPDGEAFQTQDTESIAFFASASYELTDQLTIAGGIRWSDDERDFTAARPISPFGGPPLPLQTVEVGDDDVSWDVSATYAVDENINLYARIARGFRAPSIQGRVLFGDAITTADSETLTSYEFGLKSTLLDGRIIYNINGFYYDLDDQQLTAIGGAGNFNQLLNAADGQGYGIEAELDILITENLTLTSGFSWNETEIQDENLTVGICGSPCTVLDEIDPITGGAFIDGNPFPNAPEFIANAVLSYERDLWNGTFYAVTDWAFRSDANIFLYESVEFESDAFVEGGLRAGYRYGKYEFSAFGRNLTDVNGVTSAIDFNNFTGIFNQPRTWGIELKYTY